MRMVRRTSQALIFAAFKHHTIKKILGNTLRVLGRIRKMFGQVMISEAQMHQSYHSPIEIPTEQTSFMILSLNVQVNVTSRHRPLPYLLRQHSYPPVIFLQEIGKVAEKYIFHPLYAACYTQVTVNSSGVAVLIRRIPQFRVLEEYYSPDNRAEVIRLLYMEKREQLCNVYLKVGAEPHEIRLTMRRRRRRCGPPVGCTRGTSPWCPPALIGLAATERGFLSQAVRLSIMAAALLLVSSPCLLARTTCTHSRPTRCWNPPKAQIGGRGGAPAPLPARSATPPQEGGHNLTGVGP